ncbi:Bromo adjacent homology (BAH) domain [Arabidopsis thaliana x Arabidopsis arenosa]|uniref:Bromo adjacent homology (BAH) domain n=1 Tax=Arabidopsis thaliana x Arabidopsis arenosa TaxID=1240361 RepID=A0A8T1ZLL2_9BRAS|nr:Bromo adjacent homology (BAH) domain [Arabidopsis thaliana x Arabidopsis arenosa]
MSIHQANEVVVSEGEDNVPLSTLRTKDIKLKQKREESKDMRVKKKAKFDWRPSDSCAKSIGKPIKFTGKGGNKKCHYETFEFHGKEYRLEDFVELVPENPNQKEYIAIIKDIYIREKDGLVKMLVQWFYRREDIEEKDVGEWKSEDSREIFFSFHYDEVFAESAKYKCHVYFVPDDKQVPNRIQPSGFIVQMVYDNINKEMMKFSDESFDEEQKFEIDILVAKTISRIGDLVDVEKVQTTTIPSRRRLVRKCERMSTSKPISEKSKSLPSSDLDRDKILVELLEAVLKNLCCESTGTTRKDVVQVVLALEEALYDSFADDIPKYNYKLELLVKRLKNSRVLARGLLSGKLKPEQAIKMADFEEPILVEDVASTSKNVGHEDCLED